MICSTCRGAVATGSTTERSTPDSAMDARRPSGVPSVKGRVWLAALSFSRVDAAILGGKVWVWKSITMISPLVHIPHLLGLLQGVEGQRWGADILFRHAHGGKL